MTIRSTARGAVRAIGFDRPERRNAITAEMYTMLADALDDASRTEGVKVVVIHGHEGVFTAGNDLEDFLNDPPTGDTAPVFRFLKTIAGFRLPVIAAVSGPAVGIGTTLLLHCDLVYAADTARFSLPFTNLGLCPEAASSFLLPMIAGHARAAEKLLFGEAFGADEALAMGLVNEVLPADRVLPHALGRAAALSERPLVSLMQTKALMKAPFKDGVSRAMRDENVAFGRLLAEPAAREAFTAFLAKRKPDFARVEAGS
ncbi:MAG: enoyl-CoA hydratase [Lautropia sp.]